MFFFSNLSLYLIRKQKSTKSTESVVSIGGSVGDGLEDCDPLGLELGEEDSDALIDCDSVAL